MTKVLVIATSHKTRGGITSVIKAHQKGEQWKEFHCKWIETHIDKGSIFKLFYFCKGWILFMLNLPFYDIVHIHTSEPPSAIRKCLFMWWSKLWKRKLLYIFMHSLLRRLSMENIKKYTNIFSAMPIK